MSYYKVCPYCKSCLDPGEVCDCQKEESRLQCCNTESGKVEKGLPTNFSAFMITE